MSCRDLPTNISLDRAVNDVAETLHNLQRKYENQPKVGLIADSATVQFQIAASAQNSAEGELKLAAPLSAGSVSAGLSDTLVNEGSRGNIITLEFKNLATADLSKGAYSLKGVGERPTPLLRKKGETAALTAKPGATPAATIVTTPSTGLSIGEICDRTQLCVMNKDRAKSE